MCFDCGRQRPSYTSEELDAYIAWTRTADGGGGTERPICHTVRVTAAASSGAGVRSEPSAYPAPVVEPAPAVFTLRLKPSAKAHSVAFYDRKSRFGVDAAGETFRAASGNVGDLLACLAPGVEIVYRLGKQARRMADLRKWGRGELPDGWQRQAHYLDGPVYRFTAPDGRTVQIHEGDAFGFPDATPAEARSTYLDLDARMVKAFDCRLLNTARATGQRTFLSSIKFDKKAERYVEWPVLPPDQQKLIQSTTGQGRIEFLGDGITPLDGLLEIDGRLMYAACARRLPLGPGLHSRARLPRGHEQFRKRNDDLSYVPGRYRVRVTVPAGWSHVGLLGTYNNEAREWEYPCEPGEIFETWADGCELLLAASHGWLFDIEESLTFDWRTAAGHGNPLDKWLDALLKIENDSPPRVARAVRLMIITTIGAFSQRAHTVEKSSTNPDDVPIERAPTRVGDEWFWNEETPVLHPEWSHPEWAAAVWAKARARITAAALDVPREQLLGVGTDALWINTASPDAYADTADVGQLRRKFYRPGPLDAPKSRLDIQGMKNA